MWLRVGESMDLADAMSKSQEIMEMMAKMGSMGGSFETTFKQFLT